MASYCSIVHATSMFHTDLTLKSEPVEGGLASVTFLKKRDGLVAKLVLEEHSLEVWILRGYSENIIS